MFLVVAIMTNGIIIGYLLRSVKRVLQINERLTMWAIYLLLFVMGLEIGSDADIMDALPTLGLKALIISFAGILGSIVAAFFVYRFFFREERHERD